MYGKLAKIAEKDNLTLLFIKAPAKVRAFIMKAENGTYIIVNDSLSDIEKEKAFHTWNVTLQTRTFRKLW